MWACPHPGGLQMLPELVHGGVGDAHVPEHSLQFRGELTAALRLMGGDKRTVRRDTRGTAESAWLSVSIH